MEVPYTPQRMKLVLIATFFGFAIACALVIILETLREVIRTSNDVQDKLGVTCLGVIPMVKKRAPSWWQQKSPEQ